jgi:ribose 5-phosphate isomerase A
MVTYETEGQEGLCWPRDQASHARVGPAWPAFIWRRGLSPVVRLDSEDSVEVGMETSQLKDSEEAAAGRAAAQLVEDGMLVGLGTGTTVAHFLPALAKRELSIRCVATSPRTEEAAKALGIEVEPFSNQDRLDIAIDGADQIAPDGWLMKGGGAAHTREKLVAITAERFIVIADSTKLVPALHGPVPVELLAFGLASTLRRLGSVELRDVPRSPDGGVIGDFTGDLSEPAKTARFLSGTPGVVEHGLFPPEMVTMALVAHGQQVETITFAH